MSITIEMPKLSDTMTEGTLLRWIKKVGDSVEVGDVIAEVETDKATMEMEAFDEGTLAEVYVEEGQKVQVGRKLAILTGEGEEVPQAQSQPEKAGPDKEDQDTTPETVTNEKKAPARSAAGVIPESPKQSVPSAETSQSRTKASPLARKVAAQLGVELTQISGSGPGGRIVRGDVLAAAKAEPKAPERAQTVPKPEPAKADQRIPLSGMRRTIANRLFEAKTTIPHFYLQAEIDAQSLVSLRQQINSAAEGAGLPKITVNDFILKATAVAASRVPQANAAFAGDAIVQYADVQLACAVAVDEGLVTPVIREAQRKSLSQISSEIKDLAARARSKKLKPEEYQGGTITVSNLGGYGVEQFFAIINPPQSVIVSVGAIVAKPVVNDQGQIVAGQRIVLGLSCDHRVVDGAIGAQLLAELKRLLETPALMLI
jgi:Pyruvate/2-oxoglutarate dehydrogenase complex, dihydrolipoamide acyltransferase (E2) component, and related enzymes